MAIQINDDQGSSAQITPVTAAAPSASVDSQTLSIAQSLVSSFDSLRTKAKDEDKKVMDEMISSEITFDQLAEDLAKAHPEVTVATLNKMIAAQGKAKEMAAAMTPQDLATVKKGLGDNAPQGNGEVTDGDLIRAITELALSTQLMQVAMTNGMNNRSTLEAQNDKRMADYFQTYSARELKAWEAAQPKPEPLWKKVLMGIGMVLASAIFGPAAMIATIVMTTLTQLGYTQDAVNALASHMGGSKTAASALLIGIVVAISTIATAVTAGAAAPEAAMVDGEVIGGVAAEGALAAAEEAAEAAEEAAEEAIEEGVESAPKSSVKDSGSNWLKTAPSTKFMGLQAMMQTNLAGSFTDDLGRWDPNLKNNEKAWLAITISAQVVQALVAAIIGGSAVKGAASAMSGAAAASSNFTKAMVMMPYLDMSVSAVQGSTNVYGGVQAIKAAEKLAALAPMESKLSILTSVLDQEQQGLRSASAAQSQMTKSFGAETQYLNNMGGLFDAQLAFSRAMA